MSPCPSTSFKVLWMQQQFKGRGLSHATQKGRWRNRWRITRPKAASLKSWRMSLTEEAKRVKGVTDPMEKPECWRKLSEEDQYWDGFSSCWTSWEYILFFPPSGSVCLPCLRNKGDIWWQNRIWTPWTCDIPLEWRLSLAICSLMFNKIGNQGNLSRFCFPKAVRGT